MDKGSYRIELHRGGEIVILGRSPLVRAHFRTLDPFYSQLIREGVEGWLLLVREDTGQIVARRRVEKQRPSDPQGTPDPKPSGSR